MKTPSPMFVKDTSESRGASLSVDLIHLVLICLTTNLESVEPFTFMIEVK